jgi:hypothetical protein
MRLAIALLLSAVVTAPAIAQQPPKSTVPPKPAGQQQKAQDKGPDKKASIPEQQKLSEQEEVLRQRFLLKEKFNKGWDVTAENEKDHRWIASRCKTEARKEYPGIHPIKRRRFIKECVARAGR